MEAEEYFKDEEEMTLKGRVIKIFMLTRVLSTSAGIAHKRRQHCTLKAERNFLFITFYLQMMRDLICRRLLMMYIVSVAVYVRQHESKMFF